MKIELFYKHISIFLLISFLSFGATANQTIKSLESEDVTAAYAISMAQLALSKVDSKYSFEFVKSNGATSERQRANVSSGVLDLWWSPTDQATEDMLLPIRIPLFKGLLGYRVCLIRSGSQEMFHSIRTLDGLKKIRFGQGTAWADTKIMEANGLTVIKTPKYKSLFYMLDGGRFDCFPRGAHEPWSEMKNFSNLPLEVENKILLVYRMPFYFFTNKRNVKFAADLELGLNRAISDGSFDKLFYGADTVKSVIENANLDGRLVFELNNPDLPKETPLNRPELWVNTTDLKNHTQ